MLKLKRFLVDLFFRVQRPYFALALTLKNMVRCESGFYFESQHGILMAVSELDSNSNQS